MPNSTSPFLSLEDLVLIHEEAIVLLEAIEVYGSRNICLRYGRLCRLHRQSTSEVMALSPTILRTRSCEYKRTIFLEG